MKVCLISYFYNYGSAESSRDNLVFKFFSEKGDEVYELASDYNHHKKQKIQCDNPNVTFLNVIKYKKNLSLARMASHIKFNRDCIKHLNALKPDIVYCITPPNSSSIVLRYCKKNKIKCICDVLDLWPHSLPIKKSLKALLWLPLTVWKRLLNICFKLADKIVLECGLYKNYVPKKYQHKTNVVRLAKLTASDALKTDFLSQQTDKLEYFYLGSINHLIDINLIVDLMVKTKPCCLHIVGDGEKKTELTAMLDKQNLQYIDCGKVFDEQKKLEIANKCDYALNLYKKSAVIGLTYKSIDYFCYGLPIINSIGGDTERLVDSENCGINITAQSLDGKVAEIVKPNDKQLCLDVFDKYFSYGRFKADMQTALEGIFEVN